MAFICQALLPHSDNLQHALMMKLPITCLILSFLLGVSGKANGQGMNKLPVEVTDIHFVSGGFAVEGWLFLPAVPAKKKLPAIVMAPGFSGIKSCNYQFFANNFAKEGYAVLLFDYPNFGGSTGAFRGEVDPAQQIQAYRDGLSFLETRTDIDPNRLGVWGGSYSGGHALMVSALDKRVKCLVAMTPFISGSFYWKHLSEPQKTYLSQLFQADRLARVNGAKPAMIPVATADPTQFSAISSPNAWEFIQSFKSVAPDYVNSVTLKSLEMEFEYEPGYYVAGIGAIPKLFLVARQDELIPEALIQDAFAKASEPKKLDYIEGNHFSPYMEKLEEASRLAIEWFQQHL